MLMLRHECCLIHSDHIKGRDMKRINKVIAGVLATAALGLGVTACSSDADVASENVSKAADNFEVNRRIVMFNGITDKYLMVIVGACSIEEDTSQLEVICKTGPGEYKKHFLHLVIFASQQATSLKGNLSCNVGMHLLPLFFA